jgi:predicted  nucleic acid-binding Zn-ribbon protein
MAGCPHCGEVVAEGQETCFACGTKVRARVRRHERPHNAAVFVFAGVLVLAVIVGFIVMHSGRAKRARSAVSDQEQARIMDSVHAAVRAKHDSTQAVTQNDATAALVDEVNNLEARFDIVRKQVVKDQPSPAQAKLISQISTEIARLRQLTVTIGEQPGPEGDSLKSQLRAGERMVRTLISDFSRAPTK